MVFYLIKNCKQEKGLFMPVNIISAHFYNIRSYKDKTLKRNSILYYFYCINHKNMENILVGFYYVNIMIIVYIVIVILLFILFNKSICICRYDFSSQLTYECRLYRELLKYQLN